jgi:CubicO group peptidase (beta-lactamase class C family)
LRSEGEPGHWKQKALTLIGAGVFVVFLAGLGIYTFVMAVSTKLHPNPQEVPSVALAAPSPKWAAAVDQGRQLARAGLVRQNLPGLSVAVGVEGDIVWAEGFGWADMEKRVPVAPGMRFRIGHTSKSLTSAAVGLLLEKGKLHLEDEIQTYVPEFPRKQWPVTLRQLMGHVAGVRHYESEEDSTPTAHCERAVEGLKRFADHPLRFEPDSQYGYSTFGWVLVSAAVEAAAKEPLSTFMTAQIFRPLGMTATTFESSTEPMADRVTFYQRRFTGDGGEGVVPAATVDYSCFAGAAAILSTPSDLVRFGLAINGRLRQGFGAQAGPLLQPDTVQKLQTPQLLTSGKETEYGLGWMVEEVTLAGEPTRMVHHASRSLKGGTTSFMTFPARGMVVAVTANIANAITRDIALSIAQAFAEQGTSPAAR